jgi:hypothetical protein
MLAEKYGEPFRKAVYEPGGTDVKQSFIVTVNGYLLNQLEAECRQGSTTETTSS